jgi:integrase
MQWLIARHGRTAVNVISYPELVKWTEQWAEEGNAPATINRKLSLVSRALTECRKMGYLEATPDIPRLPVRNAKLRWLTEDEWTRLSRACASLECEEDGEDLLNLLTFLLYTGCRLSEALNSRRGLLAFHLDQVTFTDTKNGRDRTVPLVPAAAIALVDGWPADWTTSRIQYLFGKVREVAGLPDVTLHTLRHTCASWLVQRGVDLYRVKAWLGHTSITTTERYAHLAPSSLDDAARLLAG